MGLLTPEFRAARNAVNKAVRTYERKIEGVMTLGYPRTATRRVKKSNSTTQNVLPDSGHSGGASSEGAQ